MYLDRLNIPKFLHMNREMSFDMLSNHPNFNPLLNFQELQNDNVLKSGNKIANINTKTVIVLTDQKTQKLFSKDDIIQQHVNICDVRPWS